MHELAVTKGLLKICLEEGEKHKIKKIRKKTVVLTAIITIIILQHRQKGMKTAPIPEVRPVRESSLRNIV